MTETWRCFIAIPLVDDIRAGLSQSVARWRSEAPADALRWAEPDGWHLTVAFLGGIDPDHVAEVAATVGEIAVAHRPTEVSTARLGAFPRPGSARVLWHGVGDPDGALASLADDLVSVFGLQTDEPFRAHITLARARRGHVDLRGWIERASASAPKGRLPVESLHLIRSHLGTGPARYETLAALPLGVRPT
jgi:2'-5' RNA ligase